MHNFIGVYFLSTCSALALSAILLRIYANHKMGTIFLEKESNVYSLTHFHADRIYIGGYYIYSFQLSWFFIYMFHIAVRNSDFS